MSTDIKRQKIGGFLADLEIRELWRRYYLFILLGLLLIISGNLHDAFFTRSNMFNVLGSNATIAMVSIGMFGVILIGGIDLSVGSVVALSGTMTASLLQAGLPWWAAILVVLICMLIPGLISGLLIAYGNIPPFMTTLAMMTIVRGIAYMLQVGSPRLIFDKKVLFLGTGALGWLPMPIMILLIVLIPSWLVLEKTTAGRILYAIGNNPRATHLSGISVKRYTVLAYVANSLIAGAAGIVLAARIMMGAAITGVGYEMDAIAAVVIGGASLAGGTGSVTNVVLGAFIFGFVSNILNLVGVGGYPQMVIKGLIIFAATLAARKTAK